MRYTSCGWQASIGKYPWSTDELQYHLMPFNARVLSSQNLLDDLGSTKNLLLFKSSAHKLKPDGMSIHCYGVVQIPIPFIHFTPRFIWSGRNRIFFCRHRGDRKCQRSVIKDVPNFRVPHPPCQNSISSYFWVTDLARRLAYRQVR